MIDRKIPKQYKNMNGNQSEKTTINNTETTKI